MPSSCSFLSGALKQVYVHTLVSIGPTHARLTPLSNHVAVTASGKENFITHTHQFLQLSKCLCKWFSCVLRDKYKKVSDTAVCISSKSFESHLLVIWCLLLTLRMNMKLVVFCLFAVYCSCLPITPSLQRRKLQEVLRQLGDVRESLQVGSFSTFTFSQLCQCTVSGVMTKYDVVGLCLAEQ